MTFIQNATDAVRETVENAVVVRKDAAGVAGSDSEHSTEWLQRSTLRDRLPNITLADLLENGFFFDEGQEINGWNWVSAQLLHARSRFEQLRAEAVEFLPPDPALLSWRLIRELQDAANAAARVATAHQMHPDSREAAKTAALEPQDQFKRLGGNALATIAELERLLDRSYDDLGW